MNLGSIVEAYEVESLQNDVSRKLTSKSELTPSGFLTAFFVFAGIPGIPGIPLKHFSKSVAIVLAADVSWLFGRHFVWMLV